MIEDNKTHKFLAIHVINPRVDRESSILDGEELESLIATLGGTLINRVIQKMEKPDLRTYVGRGKVQEIVEILKQNEVDVVVLNAMAKPGQVHALKTELQKASPLIEVWDRVDLILNIFDKHAGTAEAKLQINLARMRYMGPRIYGMGYVMSRQGGGIGTLGVGETNTELMKRHWRTEMKSLTDQLKKLSEEREKQLERRKRQGFKTVSIVGYTNAGKTSLYNALSGKSKKAENVLFATLNSSVGKIYIPELNQEILLSDTIGFIRNLPPKLIDAFKSTLMESINADLILHVIDVSDPEKDKKIQIVNQILLDVGRNLDEVIYVFNKIDKVEHLNKDFISHTYFNHSPVFISTKTTEGLGDVKKLIGEKLTLNKQL